jgi:hypothetical protein
MFGGLAGLCERIRTPEPRHTPQLTANSDEPKVLRRFCASARQATAHGTKIPQPEGGASRESESTCASQQKNVEWNLHHHHHHMVVATNF